MHKPNSEIEIAGRRIGAGQPTYFIADIAANHDGDFGRARELIYLAAEAGADVAKFQHFRADTIVSDTGFSALPPAQMSHQSGWTKSVFETYRDASIDPDWT
ncbi:MAG: N-acetylneuraminate synthase family protein, partial [Pseudomonadota bacterium]|nr:N-acetylneuraminate synthase family protein [Pseudomonadota bacterium]